MKRIVRAVFGVLFLFSLAPAVGAKTVCVTNGNELSGAFGDWEYSKDATYTIQLQRGTYLYPFRDYYSQPYYGGTAKLQLLGGYGPGCQGRIVNPINTIIDGQSAVHESAIGIQGSTSMLVEGMTFTGFKDSVSFDDQSSDSEDSIIVRYVIGHDLYGAASADDNSGGFGVTGKSNIRVESSLFYDVKGGDTAAALQVTGYSDDVVAVITNVTAAYNSARGLQVACQDCSGSMLVYNTILFNNKSGDLDTRNTGDGALLIAYSDFDPAKSVGTYTAAGNFNVDPIFENPLNNDFILATNSPMINVGAPENIVIGGYGSQDVGGGTRVVGSHIDLGAYESPTDDLGTQTVTSSDDNVFDATLRAAIATANSNPNATTIKFNISGGCPQVITLSSPLPDITSDVTINAYTQPGSRINTQYADYDGNLCVILRATNSSVPHALRVSGAGRLTLKGIEFEGFPTAAVRLAAGDGNIVVGNGFAAMAGSTSNGSGVRIEGSANHALIGSSSVGDRNVFDQAGIAIDFEGNGTARANTVEGNYIGFHFDGTPWVGSHPQYGVYLVGSGGNTVRGNYIGGASENGIRLSGANSTGNTILQNIIGMSPSLAAAGNGNAGVGFANGAHDNVVGTAQYQNQSGGGNTIVNNFGPGVWAEPSAGVGNRIDGNNTIHDNTGLLPIDLGGLGLTANDSGDADSGPNKLSNYPLLSQAKRIEAKTIVLDGYLLPEAPGTTQNYRLDVFWTDTCTGTGVDAPRGEMKRYVGYFFVTANGSSTFVTFPDRYITAPSSIPSTGYLFATATNATGNTSEPGKCFPFDDDYIFTNNFQ